MLLNIKYCALCFFFLSLISCYRKDGWELLCLSSTKAPFSSTKLCFPATSYLHDLSIEFLQTEEELFAYIHIYSGKISAFEGDNHLAQLTLATDKGKKQLLVHRLDGGQKLKIPSDLLITFIDAFMTSPSVGISVDGKYKRNIPTKQFSSSFSKLKNNNQSLLPTIPVSFSL